VLLFPLEGMYEPWSPYMGNSTTNIRIDNGIPRAHESRLEGTEIQGKDLFSQDQKLHKK
jgi:hypothetical protein